MEYAHRRIAQGSFEEVTEAVERSIETHGFEVIDSHDIHATLAAKGFSIHPVRIYEIQRPGTAAASGGESGEGPMPAKINVFAEGEAVVVAAIRPSVICEMFPGVGLESVAVETEKELIVLVDRAVDGIEGEGAGSA